MLPKDTITYMQHIPLQSAGEYVIFQGNSTVLGVNFLQSAISSNTDLKCDNNLWYRNFAKDIPYISLNRQCSGTLKFVKTGNDEAMILVNYIPYFDTSTTTLPTFTFGEVLTNFFLFILIVGFLVSFILKRILPKTKWE